MSDKQTVPGMAQAIAARAAELGLSPGQMVERSGLTEPGLAPVRAGRRKRYMAKTRYGVARALRWPPDWYERLLAGDDPAAFPDTAHNDAPGDRLGALEQAMIDLRNRVERLENTQRPPVTTPAERDARITPPSHRPPAGRGRRAAG